MSTIIERYCPNCGREMKAGEFFCGGCGRNIRSYTEKIEAFEKASQSLDAATKSEQYDKQPIKRQSEPTIEEAQGRIPFPFKTESISNNKMSSSTRDTSTIGNLPFGEPAITTETPSHDYLLQEKSHSPASFIAKSKPSPVTESASMKPLNSASSLPFGNASLGRASNSTLASQSEQQMVRESFEKLLSPTFINDEAEEDIAFAKDLPSWDLLPTESFFERRRKA